MDLLITGGRIVDGTGNPWFYGDIGLTGDRISHLAPPGRLDRQQAARLIDATGLVVAPGFIDIQSHSIIPLLSDGRSLSKVTQGVTTEIMGELWTPAPFGGQQQSPFLPGFGRVTPEMEHLARGWQRFDQWLAFLAERGVSVNVGSFVGGATIREQVMGWRMAPASPTELAAMERLTAAAMADGAFGIAPALIYPPSSYSDDAELTALARVVGQAGGLYIVHLRSEGEQFLEALAATIELSRQSGCPVEIYHLKATGRPNWPKIPLAIEAIDRARAAGVDIAANMYPYIASGTGLAAALPDWIQADGRLAENLADPGLRPRLRAGILDPTSRGMLAGPQGVLVVGLRQPGLRDYNGRTLAQIAADRGQEWPETLIELVQAEGPWAAAIYFMMDEANLHHQLRQPWIKISSDAAGLDPTQADGVLVHPRAYGTYPRLLARYVRAQSIIPLETAIRAMTGAVADRLHLRDRGQLRVGFWADLVLFDPATVQDHATFIAPHQLSTGIQQVWVNGVQVLADGQHTGALPGRALYGQGRR